MRARIVTIIGALALALSVLFGWLLIWGAGTGEPGGANARAGAPAGSAGATAQSTSDWPSAEPRRAPTSEAPAADPQRARRDALRAQILEALAAQPKRPRPRLPAPAEAEREQPPAPGNLHDRIGGREALLAQLNHDFMPLADECIAAARERSPELEGLLALGIETVADAELGGVVEGVDVSPGNEIADAELLECLQQTALSMILPPPPESGREAFMITIPVEPE